MRYQYTDGYQNRSQGATHHLSFSIEAWVDLISRRIYKDLILERFSHCKRRINLWIDGFPIIVNLCVHYGHIPTITKCYY